MIELSSVIISCGNATSRIFVVVVVVDMRVVSVRASNTFTTITKQTNAVKAIQRYNRACRSPDRIALILLFKKRVIGHAYVYVR